MRIFFAEGSSKLSSHKQVAVPVWNKNAHSDPKRTAIVCRFGKYRGSLRFQVCVSLCKVDFASNDRVDLRS